MTRGGFEPRTSPAERRDFFDVRRRLDAADAGVATLQGETALLDLAAWTSWTPAVTQPGSVTVTNTRSRYARYGRTIHFTVNLSVTGSGTGANDIVISLPVTAAATGPAVGSGQVVDTSAGTAHRCIIGLNSTTSFVMQPTATTATGALGSTGMTAGLASGDTIEVSGTYEAAS